MAGLNRMTGTPWHIEKYTREEGDSRRHRSRCIYYRKGDAYCCKVVDKCIGSAHCRYYKEQFKDTISIKDKTLNQPKKISSYEGYKLFPRNSYVQHTKYGTGKVQKIDTGKITIDFGSQGQKCFDLELCIKNNLLKKTEQKS